LYQNLHVLKPMVYLGVSIDWLIFHFFSKVESEATLLDHARDVVTQYVCH